MYILYCTICTVAVETMYICTYICTMVCTIVHRYVQYGTYGKVGEPERPPPGHGPEKKFILAKTAPGRGKKFILSKTAHREQ
jgi:hypothetical protein